MTFAIAARCPETGMLGIAIAASNPCVGSRCTFARAGVGAALTQHRTDPRLGPLMLESLDRGADASEAVRKAVASTPDAGWRQLACVDARGKTAFQHGDKIDTLHGAHEGHGVIAIGNLLADDDDPESRPQPLRADAPSRGRRGRSGHGGSARGGSLPEFRLASRGRRSALSDCRLTLRLGPGRGSSRPSSLSRPNGGLREKGLSSLHGPSA